MCANHLTPSAGISKNKFEKHAASEVVTCFFFIAVYRSHNATTEDPGNQELLAQGKTLHRNTAANRTFSWAGAPDGTVSSVYQSSTTNSHITFLAISWIFIIITALQ